MHTTPFREGIIPPDARELHDDVSQIAHLDAVSVEDLAVFLGQGRIEHAVVPPLQHTERQPARRSKHVQIGQRQTQSAGSTAAPLQWPTAHLRVAACCGWAVDDAVEWSGSYTDVRGDDLLPLERATVLDSDRYTAAIVLDLGHVRLQHDSWVAGRNGVTNHAIDEPGEAPRMLVDHEHVVWAPEQLN